MYVLAPYRLSSIYLRAAVGEYTAMTFLPLVIYGLWRIYTEPAGPKSFRRSWMPAVLGYTGLILSHIASTLIAGLFTILLCAVLIRRTLHKARFCQLIRVVVYTIVLNAWFLVPFLDYMRYDYMMKETSFAGKGHSHAAFVSDLFNIFPKGEGVSINIPDLPGNETPEMSFTIGAGLLAAGALCLLLRLYYGNRRTGSPLRAAADISVGFGVLALLMATTVFPWDHLQQISGITLFVTNNIQYPWRLLSIASVMFALAGVLAFRRLEKENNPPVFVTVTTAVLLLTVLSAGYFLSDFCKKAELRHITLESQLSGGSDTIALEYLPTGTDTSIYEDTSLVSEGVLSGMSYVRDRGTLTVTCTNESDTETYIDLPILYYRDYVATDLADGERMTTVQADSNKVRLILPAGYSGEIRVRFEEPWYWRVSEVLSLLAFVYVLWIWLRPALDRRTAAIP